MTERLLRVQAGIASQLARMSRRHPAWKWGVFRNLSEYVRYEHPVDALEGALPSSAACELVGVWYGDVFHAARAEELLRGLTACLDRFKQLAPVYYPWEERYAPLVQFLRSTSQTSSSRSVNLGPFVPEDPAAHVGKCWVNLMQPAPSLIALSVFCVPDASERKAAADILQKPLEQEVVWRLVLRPRFQVVPMWPSIRVTRQKELRLAEQSLSTPIIHLFSSLPSLLERRPTVPCWCVSNPGRPLLSGKRRWVYDALLEPFAGMWCSDWMVLGFGVALSFEYFDRASEWLPRLVIDRRVFERDERIDLYGGDVDFAVQHQLAHYRLPGIGAALAVKQLTAELLPLCRQLHDRAYRATERTSRSAERRDLRNLSGMLQSLLPRVVELRAVASAALDGANRESDLGELLMHPACPFTQRSSFLDALKTDVERSLEEVERVTLIGKDLAGIAAADAAQHSASLTNSALGALTFALTLLGVMSLCLQLGLTIGEATLVGVGALLGSVLLYSAFRLATSGRGKRKHK
jgi:hypothetical protein